MATFKQIPEFDTETYNRFWCKVAFTANPNMCWNWTSTIKDRKKPYGTFDIKGQTFTAHRIAYFLHNKVDPKELHALHTCDNPSCCNPAHLFLGTNADNVADKVSKGRQAVNVAWNKGKEFPSMRLWNNHNAKLTESECYELKELYNKGHFSFKQLAYMYNISRTSVSKIVKRLGGSVINRGLFTEEQILSIREEYDPIAKNGVELAKKYNVGNKTIYDIYNRVTWKHI